ncbi:MAG: beta-ketoacyl-ACP synthase III [Burkholderiaceae bacterium]
MTRNSKIVGTGSYLPVRSVSNHELAAELAERGVDTSHEWIFSRSGIASRHFAEPGACASDLALEASRRALDMAGLQADDIDLIVFATSTPDHLGGFPSTACVLQRKLGMTSGAAAFDVQAVCSGFVYALATADAFIKSGNYRNALVVGAEVFSRILDFNDRSTCVLFGDGAGAVVLSASAEPGILATRLHADGRHGDILCVPGRIAGGAVDGAAFLHMDGQAVFKLAVSVLEKVAHEVLDAAGMAPVELDWLVPHQANIRIMQGTAKKLGMPPEKMIATVDRHGNTSAASIPLALDVAVRDGRIRRGQHVLMEGVGGGFTWGAALARM